MGNDGEIRKKKGRLLDLSLKKKGGGERRKGFKIKMKIDICGEKDEGEGSKRKINGNFKDNEVEDLCFCKKIIIRIRIN